VLNQSHSKIRIDLACRLACWMVASTIAYLLGLAALHNWGWNVLAAGAVSLAALLALYTAGTLTTRYVRRLIG
jgi:hypothetical protein